MCMPEKGSIPYPIGMTEKEYDAVFDEVQNDPSLVVRGDIVTGGGQNPPVTLKNRPLYLPTSAKRREAVKERLDQWVVDNPERHRLGILAAKGLPTTQAAKQPMGSATTRVGASAAAQGDLGAAGDGGGGGGGQEGGAETMLLDPRRRKLLLGD